MNQSSTSATRFPPAPIPLPCSSFWGICWANAHHSSRWVLFCLALWALFCTGTIGAAEAPKAAAPAVAEAAEHAEGHHTLTFQRTRSVEYLATFLFTLAILHTFSVKYFATQAHKYPEGSMQENLYHFLAETEVVFGVWAAALFAMIMIFRGSLEQAVAYIQFLSDKGSFNEPKFVMAVMVVAATRPVVTLAEKIISQLAGLLPFPQGLAFFLTSLSVGPLLGSFITEPAAMTLLAMMLKRRYFDQQISRNLAYAILGLLFVNISIGGTLTHFAAPPIVMVAKKWNWDTLHMLTHFGWRAFVSCVISTIVFAGIFRKELAAIPAAPAEGGPIPNWLTGLHLTFLAAMVGFSHHSDILFGVFMIFLGLVTATKEYQDPLKLREGLLVGFFLAGLVTMGELQQYWLQPLIAQLGGTALYFGATGLTAITDNAALTYLGSLVEGMSPELKYALAAGAITGGGLTVIANAPNPAGAGILQTSKAFEGTGISPLGLFLGALFPTAMAITMFWLIP